MHFGMIRFCDSKCVCITYVNHLISFITERCFLPAKVFFFLSSISQICNENFYWSHCVHKKGTIINKTWRGMSGLKLRWSFSENENELLQDDTFLSHNND